MYLCITFGIFQTVFALTLILENDKGAIQFFLAYYKFMECTTMAEARLNSWKKKIGTVVTEYPQFCACTTDYPQQYMLSP